MKKNCGHFIGPTKRLKLILDKTKQKTVLDIEIDMTETEMIGRGIERLEDMIEVNQEVEIDLTGKVAYRVLQAQEAPVPLNLV